MNPFRRRLAESGRFADDLFRAAVGQQGAFGLRAFAPARKSGTREKLWETVFPNAATYEGLNLLQGVMFKGTTPITTWYFGLIAASPTPTLATLDTMASHTGWTESVIYDEATRQAWVPGTPASGAMATLTAASLTVSTGGGTVRGAFLTSNSAKSGTTGTLWATALEASNRTVVAAQVLQIYYTNTFTPVS